MTRVLMLAHNVAWQGSAIRAHSIAHQLTLTGHRVTLLASRRVAGTTTRTDVVDGVEIIQLPDVAPLRLRNGGLSPIDMVGRVVHATRRAYDVVHSFEHRPAATVPALTARATRGAVMVADWADLWGRGGMAADWPPVSRRTLGAFDGFWQSYTRRHADAVTVISTDLRERCEALGVPRERIRLVPVGANDHLFFPGDPVAARQRIGIPADAGVLVHTGFAPFDDHLLADVFAVVSARRPDVWIVTAGRRVPALDAAAARVGSGARVLHVGDVDYADLAHVMAAGDLMLVPYTNRSYNQARYPNRIGDYLAAGRPFVTNATGDLGRLVADNDVGIVTSEDPVLFANAALDLLDSPARREALGLNARRLAETTMSWRARAATVAELYAELVEDRAASSSKSVNRRD